MMTLVAITNPNPRTLIVWRAGKVQDTIRPRETLKTPITDDLQLSYPGKALVAFQIDGDDITSEEWIQKVGKERVNVHPDYAYDPKEARA